FCTNRRAAAIPIATPMPRLAAVSPVPHLPRGATTVKLSPRCAFAPLLIGMPLLAAAQSSPFMTGATALQTNILILRCSAREHGGTSQFASRLIGEREVIRLVESRSRRPTEWLPTVSRSEHLSVEAAVMASQIEQLPDLTGYLKLASSPVWR